MAGPVLPELTGLDRTQECRDRVLPGCPSAPPPPPKAPDAGRLPYTATGTGCRQSNTTYGGTAAPEVNALPKGPLEQRAARRLTEHNRAENVRLTEAAAGAQDSPRHSAVFRDWSVGGWGSRGLGHVPARPGLVLGLHLSPAAGRTQA